MRLEVDSFIAMVSLERRSNNIVDRQILLSGLYQTEPPAHLPYILSQHPRLCFLFLVS